MSTINFSLENTFDQGLARHSDHELLKWTALLETPDFPAFFKRGEEYFTSSQYQSSRNFIIVWLIFGTEAQYDMNRRAHYVEMMNELRLESFDTYLEFYAVHLAATKCFFDGDLVQARTLNDLAFKMAISMGFYRGQARSLFHQALTFFDLEQPAEGFNCLQECLKIAESHNLIRTKGKANAEFNRQKNNPYLKTDFMENKIDIIKMHIEDRNILAARKALAQAEISRRHFGYHKAKHSLHLYRTQIQILQKHIIGARRTLNSIKDPVLIGKLYDMMVEEKIELTQKESTHHRILKLQFNQFALDEDSSFQHPSLAPVFLKKIKNDDVRALLTLLLRSEEPLSKEDIINHIFNFEYDPTIHDQRLYKLILRTRKEINSDLIVNHYGKYSLNFKKYKIVI